MNLTEGIRAILFVKQYTLFGNMKMKNNLKSNMGNFYYHDYRFDWIIF